jgi:MoxR-like ATPase
MDVRSAQPPQPPAERPRHPLEQALYEVKKTIVGQDELLERMFVALLARGHLLVEGVPGLAKTMAVKSLAQAVGGQFRRIQFTPDLVPADIIGTRIYNRREGEFQISLGPVFANLLLADEINRATPKTQSALLEAMQEQQVSVARERHRLPPPFFVLATQNPLEMEGTYPLPEAQLDRFLFKLWVPFPSEEDLVTIMDRTTGAETPHAGKAADAREVVSMQRLARSVPIAPHVTAYAVSVLAATHPDAPRAPELVRQYVRYGGSPRGAQALVLAGKIAALLDGRYNVSTDDVRAVALPALRHRVIRNFEGEAEGITSDAIVRAVLDQVPAPSVD